MSISTLVLGLGGTGVLTLRALKRLYTGLPEDERVPATFLAFDFDRSAHIAGDHKSRLAKLDDDEFFYLNPQRIQERLRNIDREEDGSLAWRNLIKWFPDRAKVPIPTSEVEANGASQLRVLGRLGFFDNDEVVERMIRLKLNQLGSEVDPSRLSEDKRVIIASSIAGGTGAGMLVDVAYVARRQLLRPRVYAYLLLPEVFQDVDSGGRTYQNAYACIKELAYLKDQQIAFDAEYERIPPLNIPVLGEEPLARIFLCSGEGFGGADSIKDATFQIAESMLGQLQRAIQEKTLSIASNTLSADSHEEQKKRRTHCFSTVTSTRIPLRRVNLQEVIFDRVVATLRDEKALEALYRDDLLKYLEDLGRELAANGGRGPKSQKTAEDAPVGDENLPPEVEQIHAQWQTLGTGAAQEATKDVLAEIRASLADIGQSLVRSSREELEEQEKRLTELRGLLFGSMLEEEPEVAQIPFLKNTGTYRHYQESLGKTLRLDQFKPETELSTSGAVKRKAFYVLLEPRNDSRLLKIAPPKEDLEDAKKKLEENETRLSSEGSRWFWGRRAETDRVQKLRLKHSVLAEAVHSSAFSEHLQRILMLRARQEIVRWLRAYNDQVSSEFTQANAFWAARQYQPLEAERSLENLGGLADKVDSWLRDNLAGLLDASAALSQDDDSLSPEERRKSLFELMEKRLDETPELQGEHYVLEKNPENAEAEIRKKLVRSRQRVFEKRTPNPQRKGIALVMVPEGLIWPSGDTHTLRRFLESSSAQILAVRSQVEDYNGSQIWVYYEDLFNPPEHIRNIDEYFRTYDSQEFKELFHIDRRFLENSVFKEVHSKHTVVAVTCGNLDCRENISTLPRTEHICPGCGRMILSRCGNENCSENALNRKPEYTSKSCPACNGFNYGAWWCCTQHGKVPVEVPIDKDRCPRCIEAHQANPVEFSSEQISVRPDLIDSRVCPRCEDLKKGNPQHEEFRIRKDLLPFYLHGVNGHHRDEFLRRVAPKYRLPDTYRCPSCRTALIPVHHQKIAPSCGGSTT